MFIGAWDCRLVGNAIFFDDMESAKIVTFEHYCPSDYLLVVYIVYGLEPLIPDECRSIVKFQ